MFAVASDIASVAENVHFTAATTSGGSAARVVVATANDSSDIPA